MVKHLQLTQGLYALVDDDDFERLSKYKWCAGGAVNYRYAQRRAWYGIVYLHHDVLNIDRVQLKGKQVDHIDGNRLNNCKNNLRVVSRKENMRNTKRHKERIGYSFDRTHSKWKVYVDEPDKPRKNLGTVKTKEEAIAMLGEYKKNAIPPCVPTRSHP